MLKPQFPIQAPSANPVFYRTYSRHKSDGKQETWSDVCLRTINHLRDIGHLNDEDTKELLELQENLYFTSSARFLWIGGTDWLKSPKGSTMSVYNCVGLTIEEWSDLGRNFDFLLNGSGVGAVIELDNINKLPSITNHIDLMVVGDFGSKESIEHTVSEYIEDDHLYITIGDSREGWVEAYNQLLSSATRIGCSFSTIRVTIDINHVRAKGQPIKGFGGHSNPDGLPHMFNRTAEILNECKDLGVTSLRLSLLLNEAAMCVVVGSVRRCLPTGTLVSTTDGLIPIENIKPNHHKVFTPKGTQQVKALFHQGEQDIVEVQTNGPSIRCSKEHKIAVLSSINGDFLWVKAKDLKSGDRLLHQVISPEVATPLSINPFPNGAYIDDELAWFIGYFHGNGYCSSKGDFTVSMSSKTPHIAERVSKVMQRLGSSGRIYKLNGENTLRVGGSCKIAADYFLSNIKQPKVSMNIPSYILQGSISLRSSYLAGLVDSDGCTDHKPPCVLSTVYPEFARQVMNLYSSLGIPTRLRHQERWTSGWKDIHHLHLIGFREKYNQTIGEYSSKGYLTSKAKRNGFSIPKGLVTMNSFELRNKVLGYNVDLNYESYVDKMGPLNYIPLTVKAVVDTDVSDTWDIEVENEHCFYAGGILVSNSARIDLGSSNDPIFLTAKDNLWVQGEDDNWSIDPKRDCLRMANHTRVFHYLPSMETIKEAITKQYYSGEGAIMYAPEAIARCSNDILPTRDLKNEFINAYAQNKLLGKDVLVRRHQDTYGHDIDPIELEHRMGRYGMNPLMLAA